MLETTECISISNNERSYTDCMEFSLLRFVHMIYYINPESDTSTSTSTNTSTYNQNITLNINPDLSEFIQRFPIIHSKGNYYLNGDGVIERNAWAQFVSDRPYFDYYRTDGAELFTSIRNVIIFCKEMLGMDLDLTDDESDNLASISRNLVNSGANINMSINDETTTTTSMHINKIKMFLSKTQTDITTLKPNFYDVVITQSVLNLTVNNNQYKWNLYEVYFKDSKLVENKFITGHSVIM